MNFQKQNVMAKRLIFKGDDHALDALICHQKVSAATKDKQGGFVLVSTLGDGCELLNARRLDEILGIPAYAIPCARC